MREVARVSIAVVAVWSCLGITGCKKAVPDVDLSSAEPRMVLLTEQREVSEVRAAVISAMLSRGWVTEGETGNEITARLTHKGATVRLALTVAADRVTIKGLVAESAGKNYERWVSNLEDSIREALKKPEPPAPAAAPPPAVKPPPTVAVFETAQKPGQVKTVLQRALTQHNWVIEQEEPSGALVARLNHRKGLVRVRITVEATQATITYVDSQELNIDASGRSDEYEKWMRNLVDSIRANTKR